MFHRPKVLTHCPAELEPQQPAVLMLSSTHETPRWQKANLHIYGVEWTLPIRNVFAIWNTLSKYQHTQQRGLVVRINGSQVKNKGLRERPLIGLC